MDKFDQVMRETAQVQGLAPSMGTFFNGIAEAIEEGLRHDTIEPLKDHMRAVIEDLRAKAGSMYEAITANTEHDWSQVAALDEEVEVREQTDTGATEMKPPLWLADQGEGGDLGDKAEPSKDPNAPLEGDTNLDPATGAGSKTPVDPPKPPTSE